MLARVQLVLLALLLLANISMAQQSEPVMDYATVLSSLNVRPDGTLRLEGDNEPLTAVFLPETTSAFAVITKADSDRPLHQQDFYKTGKNKVFTFLESRGKYKEFKFTETGDYILTFRTVNNVMTQVPFTVYNKSNDDEFDPKTIWYAKGPWSEWSYLYYLRRESGKAQLEFRMWGQREAFQAGTETDRYEVVLKKDGDVIAVSRTGHVGTQYWLRLEFKLRNPDARGGRAYTLEQLTSRDGIYDFVVSKNQKLHSAYKLKVENGKPLLHPRQASSHQPRHQYIVPRYANMSAGVSDPGDTFWMKRLSESQAAASNSSSAAEVAGPTAEQLKRWNWLPKSLDPNRGFKLAVTDVETRTDTGFAVGEDLIVFGTGHPYGVKYLKVGDDQARDIPEGETWSSTVFGVCGTKIILTKRNEVAVFDTASGNLSKIPTTEISLYSPSIQRLHCHGFLVGTVNTATDVTDRNIIKVIDVSGPEPKVIPIKNSDYTHSHASSVAVDSKNGIIAISSRHNQKILAAKIAPMANQIVFDVSEYKGVSDFRIAFEEEVVTYVDQDWKIRQLKLGDKSPKAISEQPISRSGDGFWVRKGRLVSFRKEGHVGSRMPLLVSDSGSLQEMPGTGTDIEGTSAKLGFGGSAAIAIDKTVFIAGTAKDSIGVGERLQMFTDNGWQPVLGTDGKPVWGSQVVTSIGLMALKVRNEAGKTVIGYATYGQRIESSPANSTTSANENRPTKSASTGAPLELAEDNPYNTDDEKQLSSIGSLLETEKSIAESYVQIFGEKEGAKKTVAAIIDSMKKNGNEDQIDAYRNASKYVDDKDRPGNSTQNSSVAAVDKNSALSFLNGHWQSIRFSTNGEDLSDDEIEAIQITFANGNYVMKTGSDIQTGKFDVQTTTSPPSLRFEIGSGNENGQVRVGAFKPLKDRRMLLVIATDDRSQPTKFVPDKTNRQVGVWSLPKKTVVRTIEPFSPKRGRALITCFRRGQT